VLKRQTSVFVVGVAGRGVFATNNLLLITHYIREVLRWSLPAVT
jgi:hypothetical protein